MLMTPGLALFYGGMVRRKNVLGTIMHSFIAIAIISIQWILIGYSLSFGPDVKGVIGSLDWFGLRGVGLEPGEYAPTVPHLAFMIYQAMFAVILWFGWFGFNAGSALSSGKLSTIAFVTTHIAAVSATLTWMLIEWVQHGKPTMFGAATGAIAGLATITPAAGFVSPMAALAIGIAAGLFCYTALNVKGKLGYDDSLDAFGVHGVGGALGTLSAGLFASLAINSGGANGLFYGNAKQFLVQAGGVAFVAIYSFIVSIVLFKVVDVVVGLRIAEDEEVQGLDVTQHGEEGYFF